ECQTERSGKFPRSMRIAFIGGFAFTPKGTIRARVHPLAAELVKRGHEATIFLLPYDNIADYGREWELEGVEIRNVGGMEQLDRTQTAKNGSPIAYPQLLLELIRRVDAYQPDVIHVFKPKGFAGAAGSYFMLRGHSVVLDCDDWEGWGGWNEEKS